MTIINIKFLKHDYRKYSKKNLAQDKFSTLTMKIFLKHILKKLLNILKNLQMYTIKDHSKLVAEIR